MGAVCSARFGFRQVVRVRMVVIVAVTMIMSVVLGVGMRMRVAVAVAMMMVVSECHHTNEVDGQAERADNEELAESFRLCTLPKSLKSLKADLQTQKPDIVSASP